MIVLAEQFRRDANQRSSEERRRQRWFITARQNKAKREAAADQLEDEFLSAATALVPATAAQILEFETKLDKYDEATVAALMENQEALDLVNSRLDELLNSAHRMEDGRRVFKTADGTMVYDENGAQVSRKELAYEAISPQDPTWETYQGVVKSKERLEADRTEILDYQEKLDAARERIFEGDISEDELKELDDDLAASMPAAVRKHVPGMDTSRAPNVNQEFTKAAPKQTMATTSIQPDNAPRMEF